MSDGDALQRFVIERSRVRGELVHLDATWRALLARSEYPEPVREVLGEALAAVALLAATVKSDGSMTLQMNGEGPLKLLVVQASRRTQLRGLARWEGSVRRGSLNALLGSGRLAITIDPGEGRRRYQGIVDVARDSVAQVVGDYFDRSEQLPTRLWLACDARRAAGLLLQNLPGDSPDEDAWRRSVHLASTVTRKELLALPAPRLLRRLFYEEDVRLFSGDPLYFRCGCSRERVRAMLTALGEGEVKSTLAEEGVISVRCEFCNAAYEFDAVDVEQLFAARGQPQVGDTRH